MTTNTNYPKTQLATMTSISLLRGGKRENDERDLYFIFSMEPAKLLELANRSLDEARELLVEKLGEIRWFPIVVSNRFGILNIECVPA